jgi:CubicO group peptidase (beta-lactamase class C family)
MVRLTGAIVLFAGLGALSACAPVTTGAGLQCSPVNYAVTRAKDEPLSLASWPEIDELMEDHVARSDVAGCSVAVIRDGEVRYVGSYGLAAAPTGDVGVQFDTVWPVGSISKPITALAVLTLIDSGHIGDLDDLASDYLDFLADARPDWADITIRQLLAHGSGLERVHNFPDFVDANLLSLAYGPFASIRPELVAEAMASTVNRSPVAGASTKGPFLISQGVYSNPGYTLLGAIVAEVAREAGLAEGYEDYVFRHVALRDNNALTSVAPISMCLVPYFRIGEIEGLSSQATGAATFVPLADTWGPTADKLWGYEAAAGGWSMTIGDLARFGLILAEGQRIGPGTNADMQQTHTEMTVGTSYGLGTYTSRLLGQPSVGHGGTIGQFESDVAVQTSGAVGVAMVCNSGPRLRDLSADLTAVFGRVAEAARDSAPPPASAASLSPEARLLKEHGDLLSFLAPAFRTSEGGADIIRIRQALSTIEGGDQVVSRFLRGDVRGAARLLTAVLERERARETPGTASELFPF